MVDSEHFLKNGSNKQNLFEYIALKAINIEIEDSYQLVITCRNSVNSNPHLQLLDDTLSPCDHKKADRWMIFHADSILREEGVFSGDVIISLFLVVGLMSILIINELCNLCLQF